MDIQLRVVREITSSIFCPPARAGEAIWVKSEEAARHLIEAGLCTYLNGAKKIDGRVEVARSLDPRKPLRLPDAWPIDRFGVIERVWEGDKVVCIGGGPSAPSFPLAAIQGKARCVAINDAYLLAPFAEVCYFADARWWDWHQRGIPKPALGLSAEEVAKRFAAFAGQKVTIQGMGAAVSDEKVFMLHNYSTADNQAEGLSMVPNGLHTGSNSGYQAINLAVLAGAKKILLVGYDMHFASGKSHWHGGHPSAHPEAVYLRYAGRFRPLAAACERLGVRVINCTPGSAIKVFPFGDFEKELETS